MSACGLCVVSLVWLLPASKFTFLPLTTSRLEATTDILSFDRHGVVNAESMPAEVSLTAWVSEPSGIEPIIQPTVQALKESVAAIYC